jgi:hypothetical protein
MPTWEAKKRKMWKISSNSYDDFSKRFYKASENEIKPFLKESFLRLMAESGKGHRMNAIEVNVSVRGRRLSRVI